MESKSNKKQSVVWVALACDLPQQNPRSDIFVERESLTKLPSSIISRTEEPALPKERVYNQRQKISSACFQRHAPGATAIAVVCRANWVLIKCYQQEVVKSYASERRSKIQLLLGIIKTVNE